MPQRVPMQNAISFWEMERGQDWLAHRGRTIAGEWDEMEKKKARQWFVEAWKSEDAF